MSVACLDTLVGLSSTDYECFTGDAPEGYNESDSGYFLTDTDYGLTVVDQCEIDGWTMLADALSQAIRETKTDLRASLRARFDGAISPFKGTVGQLKSNSTVSASSQYLGIRIRARQQRGAKFVIKKLFLGLDTSGTYQVNITSNDPLFVSPAALSAAATANTFGTAGVAFPTPVELPFWSESLPYRFLEYYISFDRDGALPLNNKFLCCGKSYGWQNHMEVTGFNEDTQTPSESGSFSSYAHGLVLDGYMACEELDWICEVDELNGYFLKDVLARTIQFRGAAMAISALIDTVQVSPCTGYQLENLNSKRTYLNQRYRDNIAWIAENLPAGITDCFTCKPGNKFSRAKIIT